MRFRLLAVATLALTFPPAHAQQHDPEPDPHTLTIWIIQPKPSLPAGHRPANGTARPVAPMLPSAVTTKPLTNEVHEQTAGSFGTPSSEIGTTAGDYGQPASTLGTNASDHGKPASEHGQTASSFGTAAGNVGQTAGSYGQTAGSFGESLSTIATAGQPRSTGPAVPHDAHLAAWIEDTSAHSDLHINLRAVRMEDLAAELAKTASTPSAPDLLVGSPLLSADWTTSGLALRYAVVSLASTAWWAFDRHGDYGAPARTSSPPVAILRTAPHAALARAFVTQALEGCGLPAAHGAIEDVSTCGGSPAHTPLEETALRAYTAMLGGGGFSPADAMAASFNPSLTAATVLPHPDWYDSNGLRIRTTVTGIIQRRGMTLVSMRGVLDSPNGFGIVHGYAVLRPDPADPKHWRVLSLTPNLSATRIAGILRAFNDLIPAEPNPALTLLPVSLAAPSDNDNRGSTPDLWWDAHPGAEMEVVEYQPGQDGDWQASRLLWIPDHNEHERTRVTATFAHSGSFRWRVWSIGPAGQTVLSSWRTFNIVR